MEILKVSQFAFINQFINKVTVFLTQICHRQRNRCNEVQHINGLIKVKHLMNVPMNHISLVLAKQSTSVGSTLILGGQQSLS